MIRLRSVRWRSWNGWRRGSPEVIGRGRRSSDVRIGEARPAPLQPVEELLVDRLVEGRHLVLGQAALPAPVRALGGIEPAIELPLLEAVVVRDLGAPERVLEVRQGV